MTHLLCTFDPVINYKKQQTTMRKIVLAALAFMLVVGAAEAQKVVAHRGFWKTEGSAQNSLASYAKADAVGAFGSEFDVWMTVDGHLVVNHDKRFKGVDMETTPFADIRKVKLDNGEQLPTLDEYLNNAAKYPKTRLVLELKSLTSLQREDEAAVKVVKALKKHNLMEHTDIIAFSINACLAFKKAAPEAAIYYLDSDLPPKKIKALGLAGMDYSSYALRRHPEWVKEAHELGLKVNVWTVNKEEDMKYFISQGVDFITTDHPDVALKLVK